MGLNLLLVLSAFPRLARRGPNDSARYAGFQCDAYLRVNAYAHEGFPYETCKIHNLPVRGYAM